MLRKFAFISLLVLTLVWLLFVGVVAADPQVSFAKPVGPSGSTGNSVYATADGGYIIAGSNAYKNATNRFPFIAKTDSDGVVEWTRTYDSYPLFENECGVVQVMDAGYLLFFGDRLVKTNVNGDIVWNKTLPFNVVQGVLSSDGKLVLIGTETEADGVSGAVLAKADQEGNFEWNVTFSSSLPADVVVRCVTETKDGGYVLTGNFGQDCWLAKTSPEGAVLINRTYSIDSGQWPYSAYSVSEASDGGFMISANSAEVPWLTKVDSNANVEWTYLVYWTGFFESITQAQDGTFFVAGNQFGNAWIIKVKQFESLWEATYGVANTASNPNTFKTLIKTNKGGYAAVGTVDDAAWLLEIAPEPASTPTSSLLQPTFTPTSTPTTYPVSSATPVPDDGSQELYLRIQIIVATASVVAVVFLFFRWRHRSVPKKPTV